MSHLKKMAMENDFRYNVEVRSNSAHCADSDCDHEYGRCDTLSGVQVVSVNLRSVAESLTPPKAEPHHAYAINRIVAASAAKDLSRWTANVVGGYYGEEIGSVNLDDSVFQAITNAIRKLGDTPSVRECIEAALLAEYGYLLDELKVAKSWKIERIDAADIIRSHVNDYAKLDVEHVARCAGDKWPEKLPCCVLYEVSPGKYRLTDGRHRMASRGDKRSVLAVVVGNSAVKEDVQKAPKTPPKKPEKKYPSGSLKQIFADQAAREAAMPANKKLQRKLDRTQKELDAKLRRLASVEATIKSLTADISLIDQEQSSSAADKVREIVRLARSARLKISPKGTSL